MIKPTSYIFTLYKGGFDDEDMSIDRKSFKRMLIDPFFISLDININPPEGNDDEN